MSHVRVTVPFSQVPEWVIDHEQGSLSSHAVRLYALLQRYGNAPGGQAIPGRITLAKRMGVSVDTVKRARAELERVGALEVVPRPGETNEYLLHTGALPEGVGAPVHRVGGGAPVHRESVHPCTPTDSNLQRGTGSATHSPSVDGPEGHGSNGQESLLGDEPSADIDPGLAASRFLKDELNARGVTTLPRDFVMKGAAVARAMLREGMAPNELRELLEWCLAHPWWGTRVTRMEKVRDLAPTWQQERNGVGPRGPLVGQGDRGLSVEEIGALADEWEAMGL